MTIDVVEADAVTVVAVTGDLDLLAADKVKRTLTNLIDRGRLALVVDLADVAYIDSSGLGALVTAMKHARSAGGDIKLCALQTEVRSIFEMTRLIKVMGVYPTRQDAVVSWG
jgi:anti-sigma B factor antagonist